MTRRARRAPASGRPSPPWSTACPSPSSGRASSPGSHLLTWLHLTPPGSTWLHLLTWLNLVTCPSDSSSSPAHLAPPDPLARCLSSLKSERVKASSILKGPSETKYKGDKKEFVEAIRKALYASKIVSYAQGFMLLRQVVPQYRMLVS